MKMSPSQEHMKHCSFQAGPLFGSVILETEMVVLGWNAVVSKLKSSCWRGQELRTLAKRLYWFIVVKLWWI